MKHTSKLSPRESETVFDEAFTRPSSEVHDDPLLVVKSRKRRARARQRKLAVMALMGLCVVASVLLMATIFSVRAEYKRWNVRVAKREDELSSLKKQLETGDRRLAALQSPQGREELLIENGYLKAGDRYLDFKADAEEARLASLPANDLTPHADGWGNAPVSGGSIWRGAWNALATRWHTWRN